MNPLTNKHSVEVGLKYIYRDNSSRGDNTFLDPAIFPVWCRHLFEEIPLIDGARKILQTNPQRINHMLTDDFWITRNLNTPAALAEAEKWIKSQSQVQQSTE